MCYYVHNYELFCTHFACICFSIPGLLRACQRPEDGGYICDGYNLIDEMRDVDFITKHSTSRGQINQFRFRHSFLFRFLILVRCLCSYSYVGFYPFCKRSLCS